MRHRFLISTALLLASNSFAFAQGTSPGGNTSSPTSPAQQSAPAEKMAPAGEKAAPAASKKAPANPATKTQSDKMAPTVGEIKEETKNETAAPANADSAATR